MIEIILPFFYFFFFCIYFFYSFIEWQWLITTLLLMIWLFMIILLPHLFLNNLTFLLVLSLYILKSFLKYFMVHSPLYQSISIYYPNMIPYLKIHRNIINKFILMKSRSGSEPKLMKTYTARIKDGRYSNDNSPMKNNYVT